MVEEQVKRFMRSLTRGYKYECEILRVYQFCLRLVQEMWRNDDALTAVTRDGHRMTVDDISSSRR